MNYRLINNTGRGGDTLLYNEETAERVVPDGLPVRSLSVHLEGNEPVKVYLELDYLQIDLANLQLGGVRMRVPGTQEIAEVAEIRYKDGRVFRLP